MYSEVLVESDSPVGVYGCLYCAHGYMYVGGEAGQVWFDVTMVCRFNHGLDYLIWSADKMRNVSTIENQEGITMHNHLGPLRFTCVITGS